MDPRLKRGINVIYAIGGEKHDSLIVLQNSEEDGDKLVPLKVVRGTSLQKDVAFVQQENGIPFAYHFENVCQFPLYQVRVGTKITRAHHVQWSMHVLGQA